MVIDHSLYLGATLLAWALVRYSEFGSGDFWGSAFLLIGIFGIIFSLAWKSDKGYYR